MTRGMLACGAAAAALLGGSEAFAQERPRGEVAATQLDELVVTAQKREERLQEVPISITALTGEKLDRSRESLTQVLNTVPGVVAMTTQLENSLVIRGVTPLGSLNAGSATAGYYLDTAPFGLVRVAFVPDTSVYDLDRLEVLRGPQGTLYGANSVSGVVRVLTKDADVAGFEAKMRGTVSHTDHGGENYRGDAAVNVPLIDGKLAARFVASYEDVSGYIDRPNKENANDGVRQSYRLKLRAEPTEKLSLGLSAWISKRDFDGRSMGTRQLTSISLREEPESTHFYLYALTGSYDLGPATLSSSTSYLRYTFSASSNYNAWFPAFGPPIFTLREQLETRVPAKVFSQEVYLTSNGDGPWKWTAGAIYRHGQEHFFQHRPSYVNIGGTHQEDTTKSYAIFGELTRVALDGHLELTAGLRYFKDEQTLRELSRFTQVNPNPPLARSNSDFDKVTPRLVVKYKPSDHLMTYASYSEGFRSGFAQSPLALAQAPGLLGPVEPDLLKNYEVGAKGSLFGGRLAFEVAGYYIDWQGVQNTLAISVGTTSPISVSASVNGKSASGFGFDAGVTAKPFEGLTLSGAYSRNDLTLDADVRASTGAILYLKGDRIAGSPESNWFVGADYVSPAWGDLDLRLSASANRYSALEGRALVNGASVVATGQAITVARASASLESPSGWSLTLFADNLFNERDTPTIPVGVGLIPELQIRLQPRTIGVQLEKRF